MAIAFDNVTQDTVPNSSYSHTTSGSNRFLVLYIVTSDSTHASATYKGVSLTFRNSVQSGSGSSNYVQCLTLMNPASGANTISIGSNFSLISTTTISYTGVSQSGQPEVISTNSGNSNSASSNLTTLADNDWAIIGFYSSGVLGTYTNITARATAGNNIVGDTNGVVHPAGSITQTDSGGGTVGWAAIQLAIAPFIASSTKGASLLMGLL